MPADAPQSKNNVPQGLPPVKPPSGRFIVQLFLIPGLIVATLVLVFVFGGLAWVGTSTPGAFLAQLDNPNPDVRWRAANDLAQVLKRPESLEMASDPDFALDIAERLQKALGELELAEDVAQRDLAIVIGGIKSDTSLSDEKKVQRGSEASKAARAKLRPQRDYLLFLTSCVGNFTIPVGVHALDAILRKDKAPDMEGLALRRRQAVVSLGNLGDNMQQHFFGKASTPDTKVLSEDQKKKIREKLIKATSPEGGARAGMAAYAYNVLFEKKPHDADKALNFCAKSEDMYLRELVALALNFWDGPLTEPTLLLLARDDGHGVRIEVIDD